MKDVVIDRVVEYFVRLNWRLVATWISIVLYSLDSFFVALSKSIKTFLDPLKLTAKYSLYWKKEREKMSIKQHGRSSFDPTIPIYW